MVGERALANQRPSKACHKLTIIGRVMTIATAFVPARFIASAPPNLHRNLPIYAYPIPPTLTTDSSQPFGVGWPGFQ